MPRLERITVTRTVDGKLERYLGWQTHRQEGPDRKAERIMAMARRLGRD